MTQLKVKRLTDTAKLPTWHLMRSITPTHFSQNWSAQMAKYIFRCIDERFLDCRVGDYCIGHSEFCTDVYTSDVSKATIYDDSVNDDLIEIENIMIDCAGMFEKIEVTK